MTDGPLKVFITDPHLRGGGQVRYVANLARELTRMGHHVTIGCKPGSVLIGCAREAGCVAQDGFTLRGGLRPYTWLHDLAKVKRVIRDAKPDLIHVNGSQDHWVCALANRLMGRPACVLRTRHNTYDVAGHIPNRVLNRAWTDFQIVVCDTVRQDLARHDAFDGARMCSIHNGVDAEQFQPEAHVRQQARAEFGYGHEHLVCGIAARLVPAKGHQFLFRAVAGLHKDFPQVRILVLGQGDLERELRQLAQDCGIGGVVQFAGFRDDMAFCTQAFDIGVQPSIDCDTSSFSLKEQMAAEKPVVASDYGGLTEIVTDGVEGLVVPTGAIEPLADAIRRLATDPARRIKMGKAGRQRVLRDFTIQIFAQRTVEAYRRAIQLHHARTAAGLTAS